MVTRVLALLVIAAVAGAAGLVIVSTVLATQHPERSFSPASVSPGTDREVVVTITRVGALNGFAQVVETLPAGFTFKDGSEAVADANPHAKSGVEATVSGQVVTIHVLVADSVRYTVEVADDVASGSHEFTGALNKLSGDTAITSTIMVTATPATPTLAPMRTPAPMTGPSRSFSPAVLPAGMNREVVVTITRVGALDGFAQVVETLPAGFTFKDGSEAVADANPHAKSGVEATVSGQVVTIQVLVADSVRYTVMVADSVAAGSEYGFSGVVKKLSGETPIGGTGPTVPTPTSLSRTFTPETLAAGTNRELVVTVSGIGVLDGFAQLVETLPAGFSFKDGSAEIADSTPHAKSEVVATADGQVVMIEVLAADSVRYTVSVADDVGPGSYWFRGVVKTLSREEQIDAAVISPTATATVVPPTATVVPPPTRRRSRGGGGGGGGGGPAPVAVATATPMPTRAPVATIAPTPTPIIVPTIPATATPTPEPTMPPPTVTPRPTAEPTAMPKPTVVIPTVEPTKPPEPTAMPKPTAVPPTAMPPTEVPPTAMIEPTEPPAPTATPAPTMAPVPPVPPEEGGMPTWLIILIIVVIVAVVIAAVGFYMMRMRR